jgi:phosphoenolpyruvate carboxykinase (ATP)
MMGHLECSSPALDQAGVLASEYGIENHGLVHPGHVYWNLPEAALYEEALFRGEGRIVEGGPLLVETGKWTARAANEKYFVREHSTEKKIDWGEYNRPISPAKFNGIQARLQAFLQGRDIFIQDVYVGGDPEYRLPLRIITDTAWQSLFARNMFLTVSDPGELKRFVPEFTLIASPKFRVDPRVDGTLSETAIVIDFSRRLAVVANSSYGGEVKKSIFTVLNYLMPLRDVMSMHCSANVGKNGDVALFFGLSGTGKTTLSAVPDRKLIGDDEHGWSDDGVFNYEGGCYAKVIRLSKENEPEIYACTRRFGTILENVVFDFNTRTIDLNDDRFTENTRASYPLEFIPNAVRDKTVKSLPENIIFLTADAQGVLPPIARLNQNQAIYHFISGYTSKIAGTEMDLGHEPEITFSACFGAPFMVHHPFFYANLLRNKIEKANARVWLVNTGWVGGKYGVGKRISIQYTRNMLNAVLGGKLSQVDYRRDRLFGFDVPLSCPDVPDQVFFPENAWEDQDEYWEKYDALASRYIDNFKMYASGCPEEVISAGPKRLKDIKPGSK